uniref:Ubiquitin carboxyl-terminal hydrolase 16/45 n=1 Tax=Tetraselmis sp. GSL018 TaxID=582737 RepID=A0A061RH62_9CHLO
MRSMRSTDASWRHRTRSRSTTQEGLPGEARTTLWTPLARAIHGRPLPRSRIPDRSGEGPPCAEKQSGKALRACLDAFFQTEKVSWACPKESGKLPQEDRHSPPASSFGPPSPPGPKRQAREGAAKGRKLTRRVSFADSSAGEEPEPPPPPPRKQVLFSADEPQVHKIPGSEEQRGTDLLAAIRGNATFNKPFKYLGNDFIARVQLDSWAYDRLDVLIGPNWDDDAEEMWPEEQKVADVQIDEVTDHKSEEAQLLLKEQSQLLLDCFADLFMSQGPHGMLNILRAGFVTLEERAITDEHKPRWVVVGRFPPGQIGGAKEWVYPPDSEASGELFSGIAKESPLPSPLEPSPIKQPSFRRVLKSSLKKTVRRHSEEEATEHAAVVPQAESVQSILGTSPLSIPHFPPSAAYPKPGDLPEATDDDGEESGASQHGSERAGLTAAAQSMEEGEPVEKQTSGDVGDASRHGTSTSESDVERSAEKVYRIFRAPELLMVHLKRFQQDTRGRLQKINGPVPFDFVLDVSAYCDPSGPDRDGARYELVSIVEHIGTMRSGHYVAYVRRTAEVTHLWDDSRYPPKWFFVSDTHVRPAELSEVEECEAYMLLYIRIPRDPAHE